MRQSITITIWITLAFALFGCSGVLKVPNKAIHIDGADKAYSTAETALISSKKKNQYYYQIKADYESPWEIRDKLTAEQLKRLPTENIKLEDINKKGLATKARSGIIRVWPAGSIETTGGMPVFTYSLDTQGKTNRISDTIAVYITPPTLFTSNEVQINFSLTYHKDDTVPLTTTDTIITKAAELYPAMSPVAAETIAAGMNEINSLVTPHFKTSEKTNNDFVLLWKSSKTPTLIVYLPLIYEDSNGNEYLAGFISFRFRAMSSIITADIKEDTGLPIFTNKNINSIPDEITDRNNDKLKQIVAEYKASFAHEGTDINTQILAMEGELRNNFKLSDYDIAFCMHQALYGNKYYNRTVQATLPGVFGEKYAMIARSCSIKIKTEKDLIKRSRIDAEDAVVQAQGDISSLNQVLSDYISDHRGDYQSDTEFAKDLYAVLTKIDKFNRTIEYTLLTSTKEYWPFLEVEGMKGLPIFLPEDPRFPIALTRMEQFLSLMKLTPNDRVQLLTGEYFANNVYVSNYIEGIQLSDQLTQHKALDLANKLSPVTIQNYGCIYDTRTEGTLHGVTQSFGKVYNKSDYQGMLCATGLVNGEVKNMKIFYKTADANDQLRISDLAFLPAHQFDVTTIKQMDSHPTDACNSLLNQISSNLSRAKAEEQTKEAKLEDKAEVASTKNEE